MVLYKRKPMQLLPLPGNIPDHAEVFVMKGTNEIFTDYEKYLKRLDFLLQKKFVDAVNGKSGLTFFAALDSEAKSSTAIENVFPEVLRDPILRKVQFSTTTRMDDLVSDVFNEFRHDFFPGEQVNITFDDGDQATGIIREKAKFPMIRGPSGEVQRAAFSRYFIRLNDTRDEALLDDKSVRRDRKVFTKMNLRAFLKHSLQREAWNGAPWLVKEPLAIQYRLPMEIPAHLLQDAKLLASKQQVLQSKPLPRRRPKNMSPEEFKRMQQEEMARMQQMPPQHPSAPIQQFPQMHNGHQHVNAGSRVEQKPPPPPPPPPPPKYPIEDLDIPPKRNGVKRPKLNFFTNEMSEYILGRRKSFDDIEMKSMGMLLEVWNTLNVQCEVYVLDSFTFDDFVDAMNYHSLDVPCDLLEEVFCAVLKLIVDDQGKVTLTKGALPEMIAEEESDSDEANDESEVSTPIADVPARSTRSRLSQVETIDNSTATVDKVHRAQEMLGDRTWIERLAARDFEAGGWQVILVGLLHNMSLSPMNKDRCDEVLAELAPVEEEPTREAARVQFADLDINLRISALQMITILSIATPAIKDFLEACSDDMTDVRKRKIEYQKAKKAAIEELAAKDRDRKILLPENMVAESPKRESLGPISANGDGTESVDANGTGSSDADEGAPTSRSLRRGNDRKRKREEEAARVAEEKARKAEAAKKENKQSREFKKLLAEIEDLKKQILDNEAKITDCDADLREANVQRTKVLGKDRFCNRYYWFERNGQPFGGLPRSSTASYGYANGRIWVQGPDPMELDAFIGFTKEQQMEYPKRFNLTIPERRKLEEGDTVLRNAHEWGYYDDPAVLDNLIGWLDERGEREKKLRKELSEWRDTIVTYMDAHKRFKDELAAKRIEAEEEQLSRVSTRGKEREDLSASRSRCLRWTNSMAREENGGLHSRRPDKPRSAAAAARARAQARQVKGVAIPVNRTKPR